MSLLHDHWHRPTDVPHQFHSRSMNTIEILLVVKDHWGRRIVMGRYVGGVLNRFYQHGCADAVEPLWWRPLPPLP